MRLTQLRSFLAVAQAGGFTAAAEKLKVSQPTLPVPGVALAPAVACP
jgi:DNA-binding transcriptional LysR family regulator